MTAKQTKAQVPAKTAGTAITANVADDFSDFAGQGFENVTSKDILVPRLAILQDLSPQVKENKPEFIEGAKPGMICDVGTGELFPDIVIFLPVYYRKDWLEWAPRSSGKGLVNIHQSDEILAQTTPDAKGRPCLPNGNYIAETAQFYGFNLSADCRKSFIPMAGTQLKKARKWLTLSTGEKLKRADGSQFTPPMFYRSYELTTVRESNAEGDWSGWKIDRSLAMPELDDLIGFSWRDLRDEATKFIEQLKSGEARADTSQMADAHTEPSNEGAM